ncbi:hypothetical protein GCM10020220_097950 [Nonomuraea rubra]
MTTDSTATLQTARTCPFGPPEQHLRFLREQPVAKVALATGREAWVATRYEDIRTILSDPRFSADRRHPNAPRLSSADGQMAASPLPKMLLEMDPPEHTQARRMVIGEFTVRRMAALRPRIQQIVDDHLDAMLDGPRPADLVTALALPVPSLVICELLGVPYSDHDFFQVHSAQLLNRAATEQERQHAVLELVVYLDKLITAKEQEPTDDLLGRPDPQAARERRGRPSGAAQPGVPAADRRARDHGEHDLAGHSTCSFSTPSRSRRCAPTPARPPARWRSCCGTSPSPSWRWRGWRWRTSSSAAP